MGVSEGVMRVRRRRVSHKIKEGRERNLNRLEGSKEDSSFLKKGGQCTDGKRDGR